MAEPVALGLTPISRAEVVAVARDGVGVRLTDDALRAVARSREHIEQLASRPEPTYGVSTGFGALAVRHIPPVRRTALQHAVGRSHAAGAGPEVEPEVVRGLMLLRLRTLAMGHSGVKTSTVEALA